MAVLTIIFCSDIYLIEVQSKRQEVFYLYDLKYKTRAVFRRLVIQMVYLTVVSMVGYGLFYWQKPAAVFDGTSALTAFLMFFIAIIGTICFWGTLSMTVCNLFQNIWSGIGCVILLWMGLVSKMGDQMLGKWNVFSFTFREIDKINDWSWMYGKSLSFLLTAILLISVTLILKEKRI